MPAFQHFILMRFNVRFSIKTDTPETQLISKKGWMDERMALFREFCLPTLLNQTCQDFKTLIYFDSKTPMSYLQAISEMTGNSERFRIKLCDLYGSAILKSDLGAEIVTGCPWLLTTRLDNDDGLNKSFVEWLQQEVQVGKREVLNFPVGIVYHDGKAYVSRQESNAFLSLSEPTEAFRTVLAAPHKQMGNVAPLRNVEGRAAWFQLVHNSNVSNKIRGRRIARSAIPAGFEAINELSRAHKADSLIRIAAENITSGAFREARDFCASALHSMRQFGNTKN